MIQQLEQTIGHLAARTINDATPGFALLVARAGEVLFKAAYGAADLATGDLIRPDDNFIIASNTKQFTCVAILILAERGLLDLDEPISRFFPAFPAWREQVTIRQLMCHTSGIREYFRSNEDVLDPRLASADTRALVAIIREFGDLEFVPDTQFSYCNSAYVMLGEIVHQLSGQPFGRFLETELFAPLGMTRSFAPDDCEAPDRWQIKGYRKNAEGVYVNPPYDMLMVGYADGNISSNTEDLLRWHRFLYGDSPNDSVLPRKSLARCFVKHRLHDGTPVNYGLGFFLGSCEGARSQPLAEDVAEIWHTGGTVGFITRASYFPDRDVSIILLTNDGDIELDSLFAPIAREVLAFVGEKGTGHE